MALAITNGLLGSILCVLIFNHLELEKIRELLEVRKKDEDIQD